MVKPYSWEEIREFLIKELRKTKHVMTFGTIGSCNVEHDIDLIITKKPRSNSKEFFMELHYLLDSLSNYLNKEYKANLIRVPNTSYTLEFMKLSNYLEKDLVLHTMVYGSYNQMEKDWGWALFKGETVKQVLTKYECFFGDKEDIFSKEFKKFNYADNLFIYLTIYDRTNSNYSEDFLIEIMEFYFDFLYRKRLGLKAPILKNRKDVRKYFYELCDKLDELDKQNG